MTMSELGSNQCGKDQSLKHNWCEDLTAYISSGPLIPTCPLALTWCHSDFWPMRSKWSGLQVIGRVFELRKSRHCHWPRASRTNRYRNACFWHDDNSNANAPDCNFSVQTVGRQKTSPYSPATNCVPTTRHHALM